MFVIGNSIQNEIKEKDISMIETVRVNNICHPKYVLLKYCNINSIRNIFFSDFCVNLNNLDVFSIEETKTVSSFREIPCLLEEIRKPYRLGVSAKKGGLLTKHTTSDKLFCKS